jgi:NADPH:quinone reductase
MRAVRFHQYGDPSVLRLENVVEPTPKATELLIRVQASSLNSADIGVRRGLQRLIPPQHLPHIPGYDMSGVVTACGPAVTAFVPGDHVFALVGLQGGAQAEYVCVEQSKAARVPHSISLTSAAAVPLAGLTALQALRGKAHLQPRHRVLITGAAGGVGSFAVQLAKLFGCHVTAVCREAQRDLVLGLGADSVIDYTAHDFTMCGEQWDTVLDAACAYAFPRVRRILTQTGVMVAPLHSPKSLLHSFIRIGAGPRYSFLITQARGQDLALLTTLIDQGRMQPLIDRIFPLEHIQDAHRYMEGENAHGKVIIELRQDQPKEDVASKPLL